MNMYEMPGDSQTQQFEQRREINKQEKLEAI